MPINYVVQFDLFLLVAAFIAVPAGLFFVMWKNRKK
tara:strand:+ start:351 stop:458 length:108 start_codon:yes stop_codon:yes gene_type:complete